METYIEQQMRYLRAKVEVAKEAKENGWPDLYRYSIKTAEEIIKELEEKMPKTRIGPSFAGVSIWYDKPEESGLEWLGI